MEKHEITMKEIIESGVSTYMRKDNSPRCCECVLTSELIVGDEVVIDNYFTTIIE